MQSVNQVSKEMKNINGEELPEQTTVTTRNCPFDLFGGLCKLQVRKNTVKFLLA